VTAKSIQEYLILAALPGLMLCIVPVEGVEFRLSWHLAFLWLGAFLFTAWLTSWWLRAMFLAALLATASIPPAQTAYITLATIGIGLAVIARIAEMDALRAVFWIRGAAVMALAWMIAQRYLGAIPRGEFIGPFNADAAGVFLALCMPAFFSRKAWPGVIVPLGAIVMTKTSTGFAAACAACAVGAFVSGTVSGKAKAWMLAALIMLSLLFFWKIDPVSNTAACTRWIVWDHGMRAIQRTPAGHGMGSWETIFPLLASGDRRIGEVLNIKDHIELNNVFRQAHNEYVQAAFEMGWAAAGLIAGFLIWAAWLILRGAVSPPVAGGVTALAVSCLGWHTFHIAPLALIGCAWLGLMLKTIKRTERGLEWTKGLRT